MPKYIKWLYDKKNPTEYEKALRLYMSLGWYKKHLLALKFKI